MPRKCFLCDQKAPKITLHKFPKNEEICNLWKKICNLQDYDVVTSLYICSDHFTKNDYRESRAKDIGGVLQIKPGSYPSVNVPKAIMNQGASTSTSAEELESVELVEPIEEPMTPEPIIEEPKTPEPCKKRKFYEPRYLGEVQSSDLASPRKAKRVVLMAKRKLAEQRKKYLSLKQKTYRMKKKITSLQSLIDHLKEKKVLSEDAGETIMQNVPESMQHIIARKLKGKRKYSPEIRSFALTLQFYSTAAYKYLRSVWKDLLPHPSTLRAWYSVIDGKPGFTQESLKALKTVATEKKNFANLVLDEMSIREQLVYEQNQFYGTVNVGNNFCNVQNDGMELAKNALVLMVVGLNYRFKLPIGYFLIKGLTGSERANLLYNCLYLIHDTGVQVQSITFDGAACNINMVKQLGADLIYGSKNFQPFFLHPVTKKKVYIFYDACHMIKLVRNTLGDRGVLFDNENNAIKWQHLVELNKIQNNQGLHLATKLTNKHVNFHENRMNVRLATQTLSESVA